MNIVYAERKDVDAILDFIKQAEMMGMTFL